MRCGWEDSSFCVVTQLPQVILHEGSGVPSEIGVESSYHVSRERNSYVKLSFDAWLPRLTISTTRSFSTLFDNLTCLLPHPIFEGHPDWLKLRTKTFMHSLFYAQSLPHVEYFRAAQCSD